MLSRPALRLCCLTLLTAACTAGAQEVAVPMQFQLMPATRMDTPVCGVHVLGVAVSPGRQPDVEFVDAYLELRPDGTGSVRARLELGSIKAPTARMASGAQLSRLQVSDTLVLQPAPGQLRQDGGTGYATFTVPGRLAADAMVALTRGQPAWIAFESPGLPRSAFTGPMKRVEGVVERTRACAEQARRP